MSSRKNPDAGVKPFEIRTGIGGMPPLGGIFRAGDPATIPPHKHHQAVNVRITPEGLFTRPGLATVFDTGVAECINGLTEYGEGQGQALLLWPGADARETDGDVLNLATFRVIFPGQSIDYSEYIFILEGEAEKTSGVRSPVVRPLPNGWDGGITYEGNAPLSNVFLFRDHIFQFRRGLTVFDDGFGNNFYTVALWECPLPGRSFLQSTDCSRDTVAVTSAAELATKCSAVARSGPDAVGQLWPYNHPVSQSFPRMEVLTPDLISESSSWQLYSSLRGAEPNQSWMCEPGLSFTIRAERVDDPVEGTVGVAEVLYFLMNDPENTDEFTLMRWDGITLTVEHEMPTGSITSRFVVVGSTSAGPFVYYQDDAGADFQVSYRDDDGVWHDDGSPLTGTFFWNGSDRTISEALSWKAFDGGYVLCQFWLAPLVGAGGFWMFLWRFNPYLAELEFVQWVAGSEILVGAVLKDAVVAAGVCYALHYDDAGVGGTLFVSSLGVTVESPVPGDQAWIQAVGDRVFVGGANGDDHEVYDVTDIQNPILVYQVLGTEQLYDSGDFLTERFSRGCLPGFPGGGTTSEGFGGSYG